MRVWLPDWYPKPKARPRVTNGHAYMPGGYTDWKNETRALLRTAAPGHIPYAEPLALMVTYCYAKAPRGDADNLLGGLMDAGNGILWADDRHVRALVFSLVKAGPDNPAGIEMEVWAWSEEQGIVLGDPGGKGSVTAKRKPGTRPSVRRP